MNKKLELIHLASRYQIDKDGNDYYIHDYENNLCVFIDTKTKSLEYYVSDCYNSSVDLVGINIDALTKLKTFCELLVDEDD